MKRKIKPTYCSCKCRRNWNIVREWIWELEDRIHKVEEGMEIEIVSSDKPEQSSLSFRKMEP